MNYLMRIALAGAAVTLAGCGGSDGGDGGEEEASATSTPSSVIVTVVLNDIGGQDLLLNSDDVSCTTLLFGQGPTVKVTLRDAEGAIIGSQELPPIGGTWDGEDCAWPVEFVNVPASNFYEATVSADTFEQTTSGPGGEGGAGVQLQIDL